MKPFMVYEMTFKGHSRSSAMSSFIVYARNICQRPEN